LVTTRAGRQVTCRSPDRVRNGVELRANGDQDALRRHTKITLTVTLDTVRATLVVKRG